MLSRNVGIHLPGHAEWHIKRKDTSTTQLRNLQVHVLRLPASFIQFHEASHENKARLLHSLKAPQGFTYICHRKVKWHCTTLSVSDVVSRPQALLTTSLHKIIEKINGLQANSSEDFLWLLWSQIRQLWRRLTNLRTLTWNESFLRSYQVISQSINSPHFMESQGSSPYSQQTATCPCPEPDRSTPRHPCFSKIHFHIFLPSMLGSLEKSPSLSFPTKTPYAPLLSLTWVSSPVNLILLSSITRIIFGSRYLVPLRPKSIFETLSPCSSLNFSD